jgi:hypothetical protein
MRTTLKVITLALLAVCVEAVAHAQTQDKLSWSVQSSLRSFLTYANPTYYHNVSSMATMYLSSAARDAKTEEDFKELMVASRILYCQKVLEDLTYATPNYSQIKSNFEMELKNDVAALKVATE